MFNEIDFNSLEACTDESFELRVVAAFVGRVSRQDLSDGRQHRLLRVRARPGQVETETLRQFSSRSRVILASLLHVVVLQEDGPGVRQASAVPAGRVFG